MLLELFDQPSGVVDPNVKLIVSRAQKRSRQFTQFSRRSAGQSRQLPATPLIDQAIFEVDPDLRVSALEESLDLAEERFVHSRSEAPPASSRLSNSSERRLSATR